MAIVSGQPPRFRRAIQVLAQAGLLPMTTAMGMQLSARRGRGRQRSGPGAMADYLWYVDGDGDTMGQPPRFYLPIQVLEQAGRPMILIVTITTGCVSRGHQHFPDGKDNDCDGTVDKAGQVIEKSLRNS